MKKVSKYAKNTITMLTHHLENFNCDDHSEHIHKIRVEIKKIKALLLLTDFCVRGFKSRQHYHPFRAIFRKAGEIRLADVRAELLQAYKIKPAGGLGLKAGAGSTEQVQVFHRDVPRPLLSVKKEKKKIAAALRMVEQSCVKKYVNLKKNELRAQLFPILEKAALHQTRKAIKEILYLSPIVKKSKKGVNTFYDDLQVVIGQWHDKQMAIAILKNDRKSPARTGLRAACHNDIKSIKALIHQFYA